MNARSLREQVEASGGWGSISLAEALELLEQFKAYVMQTGPRGGKFYYTPKGRKVYRVLKGRAKPKAAAGKDRTFTPDEEQERLKGVKEILGRVEKTKAASLNGDDARKVEAALMLRGALLQRATRLDPHPKSVVAKALEKEQQEYKKDLQTSRYQQAAIMYRQTMRVIMDPKAGRREKMDAALDAVAGMKGAAERGKADGLEAAKYDEIGKAIEDLKNKSGLADFYRRMRGAA